MHPNARLTPFGRARVATLHGEGYTQAAIATMTGVSRPTVSKWIHRFRSEGAAGLEDRPSRPRSSPTRVSHERELAICARRIARADGPRRLAAAFGMSASTVYAVLRRFHINQLRRLDRTTREVIRYERTRPGEPGTVVIERSVDAGENVRAPGEDIAAGDEVFAPGTVLTPAHVGVLASLGVEAVTVHPRPRVAVLATGDELVSGPAPLAPGKIRDANRPALLAQLAEDGFVPVDLGRVGDDPDAVAAALERGGASADAVVVTGGVSVGDRDVAKEVVGRLCDDMRWMQVAIKPAKPFAFGIMTASGVPVFGLPGNPVSALVSYELFARPALRQRAGHGNVDRPRLAAVADADLRRRADGKLHLMRVVASAGPDGTVRVRPVAGQASHQLRSLADADALALVPDGDGVRAGEAVEVLVLDADRLAGPDRTWGW